MSGQNFQFATVNEKHGITVEEYHDIFGISDEDADIDFQGSDIEVQQIDSDEELEAEERDNEGNAADAIDEQTTWSNELYDFVISKFNTQCGIKVEVPPESKSDFFFNLIFSDELIDLIVRETNRYAQQKLAVNNTRLAKWHDVTRQELKAYFGICVVMAINNFPRLAMYWSSDPLIGNTGIQNIVTKKRFQELSQYLHFSNSEMEPQCGEENFDRLYKVHSLLSGILESSQKAYKSTKNLSINEGMIAFKGRLSFRQYMLAKLTKYGIKVWMAADLQNGYVYNFSVFLAKEAHVPFVNGLGYDVVMKMASPFLKKHRHIFFDNFFTNTKLMEDLLAQDTYACGTVRSNRKDLPPCAKNKLRQGEKGK